VEDSLGNKEYEQVERKGYIDHLTDMEINNFALWSRGNEMRLNLRVCNIF